MGRGSPVPRAFELRAVRATLHAELDGVASIQASKHLASTPLAVRGPFVPCQIRAQRGQLKIIIKHRLSATT